MPITGGRILLDDTELREIAPESLYEMMSVIQQNVFVFNASIKDNVSMFRDFPQEEVDEAIHHAHLNSLIAERGEDYLCGENGNGLSGGEKQRISIARAILKEAPVVLLDEATASLDPENEVEVQRAINTLIAERTVIVIAHRLKTIKNADNIIVLEEGRIAEQGKHQELLDNKGVYAKLWNIQEKTLGWKL